MIKIINLFLLVGLLSNSVIEGQQQISNRSPGLQLLFHMNEGTGTKLYDASSNSNTATLAGTTAWITGKIGSGLSMATNGYGVVWNPNIFFDQPIASVSVFAWIYCNATTNRDFFFTSAEGSQLAMGADSLTGHNFRTYLIGTTPGGWLNTTLVITSGVWHHLGVTYDGVTRRLYVDGVDVKNQAETGSLTRGSYLIVGSYSGLFLNGKIDELAVWNRAVSPGEIKAMYLKGISKQKCLE